MSDDTCVLHQGNGLVWCLECIKAERAYAAQDVRELVADLTWALGRLRGRADGAIDISRFSQVERRLIDRARAASETTPSGPITSADSAEA